MTPYRFETEDFALSEDGVHLMRSRYNFKTISYQAILLARIDRTYETRNVLVTLGFGIFLGLLAFFQAYGVYRQIGDPSVHVIYIESITVCIIPAILCVYCLYTALRKGPVLVVEAEGGRHKLRLRKLYARVDPFDVENFLGSKLGANLQLSDFRRTF